MRTLVPGILIALLAATPVALAGTVNGGASSGGYSSCSDPNFGYAYNVVSGAVSTNGVNAFVVGQTYCQSWFGTEYSSVSGFVYVYDAHTGLYAQGGVDWTSVGTYCGTSVYLWSPQGFHYVPLGCPAGGPPEVQQLL